MINKKFIEKLRTEYLEKNNQRRQIIGSSSIILNNSKKAIFALHRKDAKLAKEKLLESKKIISEMELRFKPHRLRMEGSFSASLEEYVEATLLLEYIKTGKLSEVKGLKASAEVYIGGICDFTGELVRLAINEAINKNFTKVKDIKKIINDILGELVDFDITGHLRTKYDQARNNLKKIEQMDYEISLKN